MASKDETAADDEEGGGGGKKKRGGVQVPEEWPWEEAKKLFLKPDVLPADEVELDWRAPDVDGLVKFLVSEKGFKYVLSFRYV
jgi:flap endonuclease-1